MANQCLYGRVLVQDAMHKAQGDCTIAYPKPVEANNSQAALANAITPTENKSQWVRAIFRLRHKRRPSSQHRSSQTTSLRALDQIGTTETEGAVDPSITPHIEIDPFAEGRPMFSNYALMVSAIVPRPIGLVSTLSIDGRPDLAPFSYFQIVDHNPPMFVVGFAGRAGASKDTLTNLEPTGQCTINLVSEHMIEAANACSIDAPFGVSEWDICGLKQAAFAVVRPARVQESVFSIEGKLVKIVDYDRKSVGSPGRLGIIEGVRFWVREDAIDEQRQNVDVNVLKPVGQLGGISYLRTTETFELPRTNWATASETKEMKESL
ncbi:hypothetical protein LTR17_023468 [Elasticomyces elasticus]|nr:hypothetical protein LTR17_023468 [Elasticomyces elasticus]